MGLLDNFEQRLDQLVNGPFQRVFKDVVEPMEIAARLHREMDRRALIIRRSSTVVPNIFSVELSPQDYERIAEFADAIRAELTTDVRQHATNQRYSFLGEVEVLISEDPALETGNLRVSSSTKARSGPPEDPEPVDFTGHPNLVVGSTTYQLTRSRTRIGRGTGVEITLDDPGVSRSHAEIELGTPPVVRDLDSTNGTFVDGRKVGESPLHDGAQITIGSTTLTFRSG